MNRQLYIDETISLQAVARMYVRMSEKALPAVISRPKSGIVYIDRYELRFAPLLNMDVDRCTELHANGTISDERHKLCLELNERLKELERMEYE